MCQTYPPGGIRYKDGAPGEIFVDRDPNVITSIKKASCNFPWFYSGPGTDDLAAELEMTPLPDQPLGPG